MTTARRLTGNHKLRAIAQIRQLARAGLSQRRIAEELGLSKGTVSGLCLRNDIETHGMRPTARRETGSI